MSIELFINPGPALSRDEFLSTHPPFSVALDGYVFGEPWLEMTEKGPYRNFNHHETVDRSCTSATCEQARRAVVLGFYDLFRQSGDRNAKIYVNDCDQDVCTATWILMNPDRASEPMVRMFSQIVDLLDMSAGAYPMPHERDLLGQQRWVFEPYQRARPNLTSMTGEDMRGVIYDVHHRMEQFVMGRAEVMPLIGEYERIGGGDNWTLATVTHQSARERMVANGIRAAVELFGRAKDGKYMYTIWRRSEYVVGFPINDILCALNEREGFKRVDNNGWGGALTVGGSPRGRGSALKPEEVEAIVNAVVAEKGKLSRVPLPPSR